MAGFPSPDGQPLAVAWVLRHPCEDPRCGLAVTPPPPKLPPTGRPRHPRQPIGIISRKKGVRGRAEEALEALGRVSPATKRPYPLTMVCETWRVARSSVYALRARLGSSLEPDRPQPGKRGSKTALSDEELLQELRTVLKGESVPRRGPPEGEGTDCGAGDPGRQEPGAEADAGERAAGAGGPRPSPRRPDPQWPDPDREAGRALGARTRRGSGRRRRAGAGSSRPSTTAPRTSSAATLRRRATAGRRWSRSARACGPCRQHGGSVVGGQFLVRRVQVRLVAAGLADRGLFVVRDHEFGHPAPEVEHPDVRHRPVRKRTAPGHVHESVVRSAEDADEDHGAAHLPGVPVHDR